MINSFVKVITNTLKVNRGFSPFYDLKKNDQ